MPLMTFAEYARHRGVSKPAVTHAVRDGRISVITEPNGKRVIDSEVADRQWAQNTAHSQRRNTSDLRPGESATGPSESKFPAPSPVTDPSFDGPKIGRPKSPSGPQIGFAPQALGLPEQAPDVADGGDYTYSRARAVKEHYLAKIAELDYQTSLGQLANIDEVKKEWLSVATTVRTKILGVPSKFKQRNTDLTAEQYLLLEKIVREALEDLGHVGD